MIELLKVISVLCAIKGTHSYPNDVEKRQIKCQAYFASCIGSDYSKTGESHHAFSDRISKCVQDRKQ